MFYLRLPEDLVGARFGASKHFEFLSNLGLLLLEAAHESVEHHLDPQSGRASRLIKSDRSWLPLNFLLFLLVSCRCLSGHCSLTIPAKAIWLEQEVTFCKTDTKGVCACPVLLHYFISPKVVGGRSEYKRLSFIGPTLGDTLSQVVTLIWRPADILCQHSLLLSPRNRSQAQKLQNIS